MVNYGMNTLWERNNKGVRAFTSACCKYDMELLNYNAARRSCIRTWRAR